MEMLKENQELLITINARQQMIKELFEEIKQNITPVQKNTKALNKVWNVNLKEQPQALAV